MTKLPTLRVVMDESHDGPTNMARDEALLLGVTAGDAPVTLRLYRWSQPTVSLGYFQPYADFKSLADPVGGLAVVRRLTGGGAILHDLELTYAVAIPSGHALIAGQPTRLYGLVHDAIATVLETCDIRAEACGTTDDSGPARGPFFCFARRHALDLLVAGHKIAGSAQRRTRHAVLQHGSVILGTRFHQQPTAQVDRPFEALMSQVEERLPSAVAEAMGASVVFGSWLQSELDAARELTPKYAGDAWLKRV